MNIICISAIVILLSSCGQKNLVVDSSEIVPFLQSAAIDARKKSVKEEVVFWKQKLNADPGNFVYATELAGLHLALFQLEGDIKHLQFADSTMMQSASSLNFTDPEMLQSMAQMAVTRHRFPEAYRLNEQAKDRSASRFVYNLLRFDAEMELGKYEDAGKSLDAIADKSSFHYLIRKAKQKDHRGDLEGAIGLMEAALEKVTSSDNADLYCWTLSNLGDMYGHAGRIHDSYNSYVAVLRKDPAYLYALKGIAWIAYSQDRNPQLARQITNFILENNSSPDHYLFLAELSELEGKENERTKLETTFIRHAVHPAYGDIYNKYLIELFCETPERINHALQLAEREVASRPNPETFSWLAWVHFKKGDYQQAATLFQNHVAGKTYEPEPLLKGFYILQKAGNSKGAELLKNESLKAEFELGPVAIRQISMPNL